MNDPVTLSGILANEYAVISGAPFHFTAALIVAAIILWRLISWAYKARIDTLKDQATTKDAQIALLKQRVENTEKQIEGMMGKLKQNDPDNPPQLAALEASPPKVQETLERVAHQGKLIVGSKDITTSANAFSLRSIGLADIQSRPDAMEVTLSSTGQVVVTIYESKRRK